MSRAFIDDIRLRSLLLAPPSAYHGELMDNQFVAFKATDVKRLAVAVFNGNSEPLCR